MRSPGEHQTSRAASIGCPRRPVTVQLHTCRDRHSIGVSSSSSAASKQSTIPYRTASASAAVANQIWSPSLQADDLAGKTIPTLHFHTSLTQLTPTTHFYGSPSRGQYCWCLGGRFTSQQEQIVRDHTSSASPIVIVGRPQGRLTPLASSYRLLCWRCHAAALTTPICPSGSRPSG